MCIEIWRERAGAFLQLLNFVSISGFTTAPLIVAPFLPTEARDCTVTKDAETHEEPESHVYVAYVIVGLYCLVAASLFLIIYIFDAKSRGFYKKALNLDEEEQKAKHGYSKPKLILIYFLFYFLILFYGGIEVGFCGIVPTFAVNVLKWSEQKGALVVTVVQGSNALFTAFGALLSRYFRPETIILVDVFIVCLALLLLSVFVTATPNMLWACSVLLGIGSASIMPSAYTWAHEKLEITGVFNGFYWCGFFTGFTVMPLLASYLMETYEQIWFCYLFLACSIFVVIFYLLLRIVLRESKHSSLVVVCN